MLDNLRTPQMKTPEYQAALGAFESGSVVNASREQLQTHLLAISLNATGDDAIQSRDNVQVVTLNHFILQRHIDALERKNKLLQRLVVALTIASLLGTIVQAWLAYKAEARAERDAQAQRPQVQSPALVLQPVASAASGVGGVPLNAPSAPKNGK